MPCATRWPATPPIQPLSLDPELLKKHSNDNPVFYVQYAHARTAQRRPQAGRRRGRRVTA